MNNSQGRINKGNNIIEFPKKYIVIDLETTGLDPSFDEIIEIGAMKVVDDKVVDSFNTLVKPKYELDDFIIDLTGITNEMLADAPSITEVLPKFINYIGDSILVGHNVNFDINFLYDWANKLKLKPISNDFIDTMRIGRRLLSELKHHRLSDLADYFSINTDGSHRALTDVNITMQVYLNLKNLFFEKYSSVEDFNAVLRSFKHGIKARDIKTDKTEFDEENPFYNKYVAITGTLERMLRKDAMQIIVDLGGYCEDNVTARTNYLILGNNDYNPILRGKKSSKLIKAENLKLNGNDIEIMSENVFYDIIDEYKEEYSRE